MRRRLALFAAVAALPLLAAAGFADTVSAPADRSGLALTLTQDDTALVRDRRSASLERGTQVLVVEGVARQARDATAVLSGGGVVVQDQGFLLAGIDADTLLAASVGREVTVVWRDGTGAEREERAKVVSAGPSPVFQVGGKMVAGAPVRVLYDSLPPELRPLPAYRATVAAEQGGKRELELAYLTGGLSWQADYVAELNAAEDRLSLSSWAMLTNNSGADFANARVQVMAGQVNTVADAASPLPKAKPARMLMEMAAMAPAPAGAGRQAVGGYHLYSLPQPVSLRDGERKQVALMAPQTVAVERQLVFDPLPPHAWRDRAADEPPQNPQVVLKLKNGGAEPLPAGIMRVFQRGKDGGATFVGEDSLAATPAGGIARVMLGRAFDVTARRSQTDFNRVSAEITEAAWQVRLANADDHPAKVTVRESFGGDWLVLEESAKHVKENAFTAAWTVTVPAKGEAVLNYRARVKD